MFFVFRLECQEEGTIKKSVYEFGNYDDALKSFHSSMTSGIGNCKWITVVILDEYGRCVANKREHWEKPAEPVEDLQTSSVEE